MTERRRMSTAERREADRLRQIVYRSDPLNREVHVARCTARSRALAEIARRYPDEFQELYRAELEVQSQRIGRKL